MVSVSASHPSRVIPKTIIKMVQTASLLGMHVLGLELDSAAQLSKMQCVELSNRGQLYLKDLLGLIVRVGYRIPASDFSIVLCAFDAEKAL